MDIIKLLKTEAYNFLKDDPNLGSKLGMLCLGGSLSYGTNIEGKGDVDLRGFAFEHANELIGMTPNFSQVIEPSTDTTLYSFNKLIGLLIENNPNTIELLGCKPEHYFHLTQPAKFLIENRKMFLSKRSIRSFGGYAGQQLSRLENAIARDTLIQARKEEHILVSLRNTMASFADRYTEFEYGSIVLYTDVSSKDDMDSEIFADVNLKHYPVRGLNGILNEFTNVTRQYSKVNHRNNKKDADHLNKHAMHLIRLYYMSLDILELGEINTYRDKERSLLLEIRNGKFMLQDGSYDSSFYDLRAELDKRFEYASKHTELPETADMSKIEEFVMDVNRHIVNGNL